MERKNRMIRPLGPDDVEEYLTIYLMSYPAFKDIGDEGRAYKRGLVLDSMANDKDIHFMGLFEDDTLIAAMKLIDFNMNIFGEMQKATGLMALGVHPLHKRKGAALDMVRYFEKYTSESGAVIALLLPFRMQIAVIEYARDVLGYKDADSGEFNEDSAHKVIDLMPDQQGNIPLGGTMRLGAYPCAIKEGTMMEKAYGSGEISERHRHRYEFNNAYKDEITAAGMTISGTSPDGRLVEAVELADKKFFVAVQYHPEFKSRPNFAHPLFREFISAAVK